MLFPHCCPPHMWPLWREHHGALALDCTKGMTNILTHCSTVYNPLVLLYALSAIGSYTWGRATTSSIFCKQSKNTNAACVGTRPLLSWGGRGRAGS